VSNPPDSNQILGYDLELWLLLGVLIVFIIRIGIRMFKGENFDDVLTSMQDRMLSEIDDGDDD
jgi:hypothetical protein|tara:strand:- start:1423 stop:1611 length:189 start_codon:yes stop_codon:yes gene_type:complete